MSTILGWRGARAVFVSECLLLPDVAPLKSPSLTREHRQMRKRTYYCWYRSDTEWIPYPLVNLQESFAKRNGINTCTMCMRRLRTYCSSSTTWLARVQIASACHIASIAPMRVTSYFVYSNGRCNSIRRQELQNANESWRALYVKLYRLRGRPYKIHLYTSTKPFDMVAFMPVPAPVKTRAATGDQPTSRKGRLNSVGLI